MKICRVLGTVVATAKHPHYHAYKLLMCQPTDERGADAGDALIAVDNAQAGVGDTVLVNDEGNGARQMLGDREGKLCIRAVVVGIVDEVTVA